MNTQGANVGDASEPGRHNALTRRSFVRNTAVGAVVVLGTSAISIPGASAATRPQCAALVSGGPMWVTADCDDPTYSQPVIDSETDLTTPVPHRKVSGHFDGTDKKFNLYLPPKGQWRGRFFHKVYPLTDENAADQDIAFGADSGAYVVQANGGTGYRVDAAAAKFSRTYAAKYYGTSRKIYGYVWGGSGGSFQTIGAIENTQGVWDGAVPFIPGTPYSIPSSFTVRALARLVLRDKAPRIADAVRPGGSGRPFASLNSVERAMLRETTAFGVPLRAWEDYEYVLGVSSPDGLLGFAAVLRTMDPAYADDFWSNPGYLGTEKSALGDVVRGARIDLLTTVQKVERDAQNTPTSMVLASAPTQQDTTGLDFTVYAGDGTAVIGTLTASLDPATRVVTLASGNDAKVLDALDTGVRLRLDNRWTIAFRAYHRYQVPTRPGFYPWDQYRGPDGKPLYPQRALQVGPLISKSTSGGGTHTGKITGKVIVVGNLADVDACPWPGDWYRARVKEALGAQYGDDFRLWYSDNADHLEGPVTGARAAQIIEFTGILQQALRDLSAWVEKGVEPARTTAYDVADSQITVPEHATARRGIQPVVHLTADGTDRIEVTAGTPVTFRARIEVPPGAGRVVHTEWDFAGTGGFTVKPFGPPRQTVEIRQTFTYTEPGTYFPVLKATAQREGDTATPFAQVANLGRVRVVVR
ncbi:Tat pathway signal sequence domain protein [Streptomyces sp. AK04-3B]|uniref:Tat pathway signal sequence domain protein n=1 Tax=Streptomyces sp. AK04-3B TaxID=3028650 RepID=UPI0029BCCEE0|nr:Tat pathway signal sequence domain protein [Streptomyces sp. AK04-3B]MDX3798272.1 Tat pathway signal sequence domain protein [Streptomyces sp. AK04-3B]